MSPPPPSLTHWPSEESQVFSLSHLLEAFSGQIPGDWQAASAFSSFTWYRSSPDPAHDPSTLNSCLNTRWTEFLLNKKVCRSTLPKRKSLASHYLKLKIFHVTRTEKMNFMWGWEARWKNPSRFSIARRLVVTPPCSFPAYWKRLHYCEVVSKM